MLTTLKAPAAESEHPPWLRGVRPTLLAHLARSLRVNHLTDVELPVCTQTQRRARARTVHLVRQLQIKLRRDKNNRK